MGILIYVRRISDNLYKNSRIVVIQAIALSLINHCIRIWGTTNDTLMSSVQKLQNFAVRVAMGGVKKYIVSMMIYVSYDHISPFHKELQFLYVKRNHVFEVATTIFTILRGFYLEWF